ncbi:hypothetical protein [Streptomyces sp. AK02-01A]|uniref:hypothetical protein n=1 Tax=Streptomyces sp. AK02-01A TaxID=3028648 RepID=UPI0029BA78E3|nr:hypothetical protein [Streptomyces sp. AK02-01A]MDX3850256.1 hypothetical protein [Streptomyces sp. AK02-01A]
MAPSARRAGPATSGACDPKAVAELRKLTDNVSGYVAEAVARQIRHQLLGDDLRRHEEEHGTFSGKELAEARSKIFGAAGPAKDADAA